MVQRLTYILLALNIVAGLIYFWLEQPETDQQTGPERILNIAQEEVHTLELELANGSKRRIIKERGEWMIREPIQWEANNYAVQKMLNELQLLESELQFDRSEIEDAGRDLSEYGLDNPSVVLRIGHGSQQEVLNIGAPTQIGDKFYLRYADSDRIHVISKTLLESLSIGMEELRSANLFDLPVYEIESMTVQIKEPDVALRLDRDGDEWKFTSPLQAEANSQRVSQMLNIMTSIKVSSFLINQNVDGNTLGLIEPTIRLTLRTGQKRQTLLIGNKVEEENKVQRFYAQLEDRPTRFIVAGDAFQLLSKHWERLRERQIMSFNPGDVTEIEIAENDQSISLQQLETGPWQIIERKADGKLTSWPAEEQIVRDTLIFLRTLEIEQFISEAPSEKDIESYGLAEASRTLTIKTKDQIYTLEIGSAVGDSKLLHARIQGQQPVYGLNENILFRVPLDSLIYRSRILEQLPEAAQFNSLTWTDLTVPENPFQISVDSNTLEETIAELPEPKQELFKTVLELLETFRVDDYLKREFLEQGYRLGSDNIEPWRYKLEFSYSLPGGDSEKLLNRIYYFTWKQENPWQLAASPKDTLTFTIRTDWIETLLELSLPHGVKELPEVTEPANVESDQ